MLPTHGRFDYSPITARPDYSWPERKRLAVYIASRLAAMANFPRTAGSCDCR